MTDIFPDNFITNNPVGKIAKKAVCIGVYFDNMTRYFECRINKNGKQPIALIKIMPPGAKSNCCKL